MRISRNLSNIYLLLIYFKMFYCLDISHIKGNEMTNNSSKPLCLIESDIICPNVNNYYKNSPSYYMSPLDKNRLWLTRIIPYLITSAYSSEESNVIKESIHEIESKICVKFKELSSKPENEDYIYIQPIDGCYSSVGRINGKQDLSLTSGCLNSKGNVIHELLHALGLWHEHTRPDRDQYIHIERGNIIPGRESDFYKRIATFVDLLGDYDYYSIMHYGVYYYSIDSKTRMSFTLLDSSIDINKVGQRDGMSDKDIEKLHKLYRCDIHNCEQPISPSGGTHSGDNHDVGATVEYKCDSGLVLVGSHKRYCRYDGIWSGQDVQCIDKAIHYCNFESTGNEMCGWTPTSDTKFDWQRKSGATQTPPQQGSGYESGPIDDLTFETSEGHYIYMETASRRSGDLAKVQTPQMSSTTGVVCISYAYYMWGQKLGSLKLLIVDTSGAKMIWEEQGNSNPKWIQIKLLVKPEPNESFHLIFEGRVGLKDYSDIALDEILVVDCNEVEAIHKGFHLINY